MIYSDDDVAELKKRAQVLAMLTRSDNVTEEQMALLRSLWHQQHLDNARDVPALSHYAAFLESVVAMHKQERTEVQKKFFFFFFLFFFLCSGF